MKERFGLHVAPHERPPIAWYAPSGLARVAREQLWSLNLLRNLDRRETFTAPFSLIDLRGETNAEGDVEVSHTGELYAVDDSGTVVMQWPFGTTYESLARDLRSLLGEAAQS